MGGTRASTAAGASPTSSARATPARLATASKAASGPNVHGSMRLHDTWTASPTRRASTRTCGPRMARAICRARARSGSPTRGCRPPGWAGPRRRRRRRVGWGGSARRPGSSVRHASRRTSGGTAPVRRGSRADRATSPAQRANRSRAVDGRLERSVGDRPAGEADPRHHVEGPKPGVGALVAAEIEGGHDQLEPRDRAASSTAGPGSGQGEHGAVVVAIGVEVEQAGPGGPAEGGEDARVAPLAHVDDAFEQIGCRPAVIPSGRSGSEIGRGSDVTVRLSARGAAGRQCGCRDKE